MRTVYTFDTAQPPAEFKVKLCSGNSVQVGEQVAIKNGPSFLGVRWVIEGCSGYYSVTNKPPSTTRDQKRAERRAYRTERNKTIWRMHEEGWGKREIALAVSLSQHRVTQIIRAES